MVPGSRISTLLEAAYGRLLQPEAGMEIVNEGLVLVDKRGERLYEAELWRLKGELTLQQHRVPRRRQSKGKGQRAKVKIAEHLAQNTHHPSGGRSVFS